MVKYIITCWLVVSFAFVNAQQLAFPGAEGFGRFATGGRGGTVYHVTNLNDSGAGSLRDAISQPNRIVVFDVAGVINISSVLIFSKNLTIAGQTAPGEGVVVYGDRVSFSGADNMICRYMRFRMGINGASGKDAAGIANGKNMIFDHVSVTWGRDETFSISWDNKGTEPTNITIQNSIIGQGLQDHSAGGLVQTSGGVTLYRNLYIDNKTRNPKVKGLNQYVNNVVYDWGNGGCYILGGTTGDSWATIINNYFIEGPESSVAAYTRATPTFQLLASGNYVDSNRDGTLNGTLSVQADYGDAGWVTDASEFTGIPQVHPEIAGLMTAEEAYNWIVENVGCSLPVRDEVDAYLVTELTSLGTLGKTISLETENPTGGIGTIHTGAKDADQDNDGMPDAWEDANGTDKTINDAVTIDATGYSNIEKYINGISGPMEYIKYPSALNATGLTEFTITLSFTNNQTDADNIIVEYGEDTSFGSSKTIAGDATTIVIDGLKSNLTYYFRMKSVKGELVSDYSSVYSKKTNPEYTAPLACENPTPTVGTTLELNKFINFSWSNRTGVFAQPLSYDFFIGTEESNLVQVSTASTSSSYSITELLPNTTYYWRVKTTNELGANDGDVWSFTTGEALVRNKVLHFPFDETSGTTATDITADIIGAAQDFTPTWETALEGNSIKFSASPATSKMRVPYTSSLNLNTTSFTISLWFKSDGSVADSYIFHKGMHDTTEGGVGKWIGIQYKSSILTFGIDDNATKTTVDISGADKWFNSAWHHLVCMRDVENDKLIVYVDAVKQKEVTDNTGAIGETGDLIIGNRNGYYDNPYPGNLDELMIYDSVLLPQEISDMYLTTSISDSKLVATADVNAFPNPFQNNLSVSVNAIGNVALEILTLNGQKVLSTSYMSDGNSSYSVEGVNELPNGIYFCTVNCNNQQGVLKIVKQ